MTFPGVFANLNPNTPGTESSVVLLTMISSIGY